MKARFSATTSATIAGLVGAIFVVLALGSVLKTTSAQDVAPPRANYFPNTEILGADEIRVTALGTGTPNFRRAQASASWLVELGNGDKFIFDIGTGSLANLAALEIPYTYLDKIFISHLHVDHIGDLDAMFIGGWVSNRTVPLRVWGPSGLTPELGTKYGHRPHARDVYLGPDRPQGQHGPPRGSIHRENRVFPVGWQPNKGVKAKVVFLTMHADADLATEAFAAGAAGYVVKSSAGRELVEAIDTVLDGRVYLTPSIQQGVLEAFMKAGGEREKASIELTKRQREVLQLVAEGLTMKEIASGLDVSPRTVESHKYDLMQKLGVKTTAELIHYAIKRSIISV